MFVAEYSGSCSKVFIEHIFVFFMKLFLKKMVIIIISASNPHCHSRVSTSILKILSIYRKNILGKQLSQAICSKYVFRLLHVLPKFQGFSAKLDMGWSKLSNCSQALFKKGALMNVIGNDLWGNVFFNTISVYRLKKTSEQVFSCEFYQILQNAVFAKHLWVTVSAKYRFLLLRWP